MNFFHESNFKQGLHQFSYICLQILFLLRLMLTGIGPRSTGKMTFRMSLTDLKNVYRVHLVTGDLNLTFLRPRVQGP